MMNRLTINSYCWLFLLLLNTVWLQAQTNLPINQTTTISTLTSNDFQIPVGIESLTVEVRGADGGHARLDGGTCDVRVRGGQGATMKATFAIGNGSNELRPGGLLRVFAGRAGQTDESGCAPIPVGRYGAGGGSSAILYQAPGETSTRWDLLAVAGGGGGGARPVAGVTDRTGKGGQAVKDGGDTSGSAGGKNGNCGSSSDNGYGGVGINCLGSDEKGYRMVEAVFGGSNGFVIELKDNSFATETGGKTGIQPIGGDGFTGGAVGAGGGGGGGGFSGGAGSSTWQGGGGGSYIAPNFSSTEVERLAGNQGGATNFPSQGFVRLTATLNCPTGEIQLNSQADVDNFPITYPNCTQISGQLVISGPDITDLSPLANITSIEGYLIIGFNATLADLQGLSNLQSVGGNFTVGINPALPSLNGLSALNNVGGDLIVTNNGLLADFTAICPLISTGTIGGTQDFANNAADFVVGECFCPAGEIQLNSQADVNNFPLSYPNCTQIPGQLVISGPDIIDLSPLANITSIEGYLIIGFNATLADLQGLSNLQSVGGNFTVGINPALPSLNGLTALNNVGGDLIVTNNGLLADFSGICPLISTGTIGGTQTFANNAAAFIASECLCPAGNISLNSQAEINNFPVNYPGCNQIFGDLNISGADITDLSPLSSLVSVGGTLTVGLIPNLNNLQGLNNLQFVGGSLVLSELPAIQNLNALSNLNTVEGDLIVTNNGLLADYSGICPLISTGTIGGNQTFASNAAEFVASECLCPAGNISLNSQAEINNFPVNYPGCNQIFGDLNISGADITDLSPLSSLVSVGGTLTVGLIPNLNNLQGLNNLQFVGSSLVLSELPAIQNLNALSNLNTVEGDLIVTNNGLLADFSGICPLISTGTIGGTQTFASNAAAFVTGECFCPTGDIVLTSQVAVENFAATYPNCKNLPGNLTIRGWEVLDLSPLSQLETIAGNLEINDVRSTAFALTNLVSIGGNLRIVAHRFIPILDGLSKLKTIGGSFVYFANSNGFVGSDDAALAGLNNLESVGGEFRIVESNMKSIIGFEKLTRIGERFTIAANPDLETVNAFGQLSEVGGDLRIDGNPLLSSFNPLSGLRQLGEVRIEETQLSDLQVLSSLEGVKSLIIANNPTMSSLSGLETLRAIEGVDIRNNNSLVNIDALTNATLTVSTNSDDSFVSISFNPLLTNINGLSGLSGTVGSVSIGVNDALVDIDALSNLSAITGRLVIQVNPSLAHLDGLRGLRSVGGDISIEVNAALSNFEGICPLISEGTIGGTLTIADNGAEFDSAVDCACPIGDVVLATQADVNNFVINYPNCTNLPGNLTIVGLDITDLSPLSNLQMVQGNVLISNAAFLTSLAGLSNLQTVGGEFASVFNTDLTNLDGLSSLTSVGTKLRLVFNGITNVDGLRNLRFVGGDLDIGGNPNLTNYDGLCPFFNTGTLGGSLVGGDNGAEFDPAVECACPPGDIELTSQAAVESFAATYPNCKNLPGNLTIRSLEVLDLSPLSQLETIAGNLEIIDVGSPAFALTNLVSIGGNLRIVRHRFVPILDDLSNLKTIGGAFTFIDNAGDFGSDNVTLGGLNNLESVGGGFRIDESGMKSIVGFEKLTRIGGRFDFQNNLNLEIINAFGQLSEIGGGFSIGGNPLLSSFNALLDLRQSGDITISDTQLPDLQVLSGLEGAQVLLISDNPAMSSLRGLENLSTVEVIAIGRNNSLANIDALSNLTTIASTNPGSTGVFLSRNPLLTNLNGLSGLTGTVGDISIESHDALVDIDALSNLSTIIGSLDITLNPNLTQLDGLRGLRSVGGNIRIRTNTALSNFEGLCPLISEGTIGGTLTITNNAAEFDSAVDCACFADATPPVAQCKDIIVNLDANGQASVLPTDLDDGSFDDCGEVVVSFPNGVQQFDFGCDDVLTASIVIVEVTNAKGLSSTCFSEIGITEDIAPVVSCKDITVELNANGLGSYSADMLDDGVVDNCGLGQNSYPVIPVTCNEIGTFPVTYTVRDKAGNEGACTGNVTVIEKVAPVALCQDLEVTLDEAGQASIIPTDIDNGSSDNCGTLDLTANQTSFTAAQLGENTVTLTATDGNGNSSSCTSTVTVEAGVVLIAYVWDDQDGDGKQDANEPALAEASVELIDHATGAVLQQAQTNVEGEATFEVSGIGATQRVKLKFYEKANHRFTLKDKGSNDNIDSDASRSNGLTAAFTLDADGKTEKWDCGLWAPGTIQSFVWDDQDGDGKQDGGEPGFSGAQVDLLESDGTLLATTTTDENGLANFTQVPADRPVKLKFYTLPNLSFTLKDRGSNNNIDSDASRTNGMTATFQANKGSQSFESWDAGMWSTGMVQAYVWDDQDGDGKQDGGEPAIAGVRVDLLESDGAFIETAQTDASGIASFSGIPTNRPVKLQFFEKDDHRFTLKDQGSNDNIDSDASRTNGMTATFQPSMGNQTIQKWDAGLWSPGQVKAYVWDDQDGDGKQDAAEPAVEGVEVKLLESDGALLATGQTDASGIVTFTDVPADRPVKLQFFEKADHRFTLKDQGSNNNIDSDASRTNGMTATFQASKGNQTTESWDAGLWSPGEVEAYVWDDRDGDGKQDAGEPGIKGVSVHLLESDGTLVQTGTTGAGGLVNFDNVAANRPFKLQFFTLPGFEFTLKDRGSNNNIDSDASRSNGMTATFQASTGNQTFRSWDAGLWSPGTVEAYVWDDLDGDGKQDEGEPAIANAKVDLLESDGTLMQTTTTDENGLATFGGVPADRAVKLQFFEPIDHRFTLKDKGSNDNIDSDASRSNGMTGTFQASQGGQVHTKMDCGLWSPGEVEAYVWNDLDGDGKQDAGEPGIEGVFVDLLESNNDLLVSTATDADGIATILDVPANRAVKLQFTAPAGYSITLKDRGSNDFIDSDASLSNGRTATFQATMGQQLFVKWDAGLVEEGTSGARLVQEQLESPTAPVAVEEDLELEGAGLSLTAFPNPFSEQLTLEFYTSKAGPARIDVFNLQGQLVRNLFNGQLDAGQHQVQRWDGTGANAKSLPAGMYLIQMKTGEEIVNQKVLLQR